MRRRDLTELHRVHKLELMARSPQAYRELGRLAAAGDERAYLARLAPALQDEPTVGRHANALRHAAGYLPQPERAECTRLIDELERGRVGVETPRRAIQAAASAHGIEWLTAQTYLRRPGGG